MLFQKQNRVAAAVGVPSVQGVVPRADGTGTAGTAARTRARGVGNVLHGEKRSVALCVVGALVGLLALQIWRPYYFLTNDNFNQVTPILSEVGHRLASGQSPAWSPHLFGGRSLLHDASALFLWNPLVLGATLLAPLGFPLAIVDVIASSYLLLTAALFALMCCRLRDMPEMELRESLSDGRIIFLSLSWTFSMFAVVVAASWVMFGANQAALPALMLGLLAPTRRAGVAWITFGTLLGLIAGHMSPFLWALVAFSLLSVAWSLILRSPEPLLRWAGGTVLAMIIASPVLIPALSAFLNSGRSKTADIDVAPSLAIKIQILSFFTGALPCTISRLSNLDPGFWGLDRWHSVAMGTCAASGAVWHGLSFQRKSRGSARGTGGFASIVWTPRLLLCCALVAAACVTSVLVMRPDKVQAIIKEVPLLRSLRNAFREILLLSFWLHLWLALVPVRAPRWFVGATGVTGVTIFLVSLFGSRAPTFGLYERDRKLVMAGVDSYWNQVRPLLKGRAFIPVADEKLVTLAFPYVLCGAFNFPALYQVHSMSGSTAPGLGLSKLSEGPYNYAGLYSPAARDRLLQKDPRLMAITVVQLEPLRIELSDARGTQTLPVPDLPPTRQR